MCGFIRARNNFSKILEMLFRLEIERNLAGDDVSKPGFLTME